MELHFLQISGFRHQPQLIPTRNGGSVAIQRVVLDKRAHTPSRLWFWEEDYVDFPICVDCDELTKCEEDGITATFKDAITTSDFTSTVKKYVRGTILLISDFGLIFWFFEIFDTLQFAALQKHCPQLVTYKNTFSPKNPYVFSPNRTHIPGSGSAQQGM